MTATNPTHAAEVLPPQMVRQADDPTPQAGARAGDDALVSSTWHRARSALSVTVAGALIAGLFLIANSSFNRNFDGVAASIGLANARMDRLEVRMDRLEVKVDALDDRMDRLEVRMGRLEVKVDALDDRMEGMAADISAVLAILTERGDTGAVPETGAAGT